MKTKRILGTLLVLCMLIALFPVNNAFADDNKVRGRWMYKVEIMAANEKNAEANGAPDGIRVTLKFSDGKDTADVIGIFDKCNKKNNVLNTKNYDGNTSDNNHVVKPAYCSAGWIYTNYAPWSLRTAELYNRVKDGFKLYNIKITAKYDTYSGINKNNKANEENYESFKLLTQEFVLFNHFPEGEKSNHKGGIWLHNFDNDDRGLFDIYNNNLKGVGRNIYRTGNFTSNLGRDIHLNLSDSTNNTAVNVEWDGKFHDQYSYDSARSYNALMESDPPTFEFGSVIGKNGSGKDISVDSLKGYGINITEKGYSYTPSKLLEQMCEQGVSSFSCLLNMKLNGSVINATTVTFTRNTFSFSDIKFENVHYTYGGNSYYTNGKSFGNKEKTVRVKFTLASADAEAITKSSGSGLYFEYKNAYIKTTTETGEKTIYAEKTNGSNKAKISGNSFTLDFKYSEIDSLNNGTYLVIEDGKIVANKQTFVYYDFNKTSDADKVNTNYSTVKLDSKAPAVTVARTDNKANTYAKNAEFTVTTTENSYVKTSASTANRSSYEGKASMYLVSKENGNKYSQKTIPLTKDSDSNITVSLDSEVEGEFELVVEGEDIAKNTFEKKYDKILLDNKAPETKLVSTEKMPKENSDGSLNKNISNKYNVKLSDKSGTGKIWYIFTEDSYSDIINNLKGNVPANGENAYQSGEIKSIVGKWAYIEQKDLKNGENAQLVLTLKEKEEFNGTLIWFAVDGCGNKTGYYKVENIKMANETADYTISPTDITEYKPSYVITVTSPGNKIYYRWQKIVNKKTTYLFYDYRETDGIINTANDPETVGLDGEYILDLKIRTPKATVTLYPKQSFIFDSKGPDISASVPKIVASSHNIDVSFYDKSGVDAESVTAQIVDPDKNEIDGMDAFSVAVSDDKAIVTVKDLPNGAYKLKLKAKDTSGNQSDEFFSDMFYIKNGAPGGSVTLNSEKNRSDSYPVIKNGETLSLNFNITEEFQNASLNPYLYYRTASSDGSYGQWINAGMMSIDDGNTLNFEDDIDVTGLAFENGKNTLYVQTMIYHPYYTETTSEKNEETTSEKDEETTSEKNVEAPSAKDANIRTDEIIFYLDEEAPDGINVIIDDIHTKTKFLKEDNSEETKPIEGWVEVNDNSLNFGGVLTAECDNTNVKIGDYVNGAFKIAVEQNVTNAMITVYDEAGNKAEIFFSVKGIDNEAPSASLESVSEVIVGDAQNGRKDAEATVKINGMADISAEDMFALIPAGEYSDTWEKIPEKYFRDNLLSAKSEDNEDNENTEKNIRFTVTKLRSEAAEYEGEVNNTYKIEAGGMDGEYYIGLRTQDSLGNSVDIVFSDEPLILKDSTITTDPDRTVSPHDAEEIAVVTVEFNVPVYLLPQDKIAASVEEGEEYEDEDAKNCALAKEYADSYSQKVSFTIDKTTFDSKKDIQDCARYDLYLVDDLGRTEYIPLFIYENDDVVFGSASSLDYTIVKWSDDAGKYVPLEEGTKKICVGDDTDYRLVVEPTGDNAKNTVLRPVEWDDDSDNAANGFLYPNGENEVQVAEVDSEGKPTGNTYTFYEKIVYTISQVTDENGEPTDITDRVLKVKSVAKTGNPDLAGTKYIVVSEIDNTAPKVSWSVTPEVLTEEVKYELTDDGEGKPTSVWTKHPTYEDVTFTITAQDKESGIEKITAFSYNNGADKVVVTPDTDGKWIWKGEDNPITVNGTETKLPLTITYSYTPDENGDIDKYGVHTLTYTFTGEADMTNMLVGIFENSLGVKAYPDIGGWNGGISTKGIINKLPAIAQGTDFNLYYTDKNGNKITDMETAYYNNATAVIEITQSGKDRGLYVANNGLAEKKALSVYQPSFEFKLKDIYGNEASVTAKLIKTDNIPAEISYTLSETRKTNQDITVAITATDSGSGVASVTLGEKDITSSRSGDTYTGKVSENGTYSIVVYDKAGNKSVKTFNVSNVKKATITAKVEYSGTYVTEDKEGILVTELKKWDNNSDADFYTSRSVTATLSFSESNVKITKAYTSMNPGEYSINYGDAVVTFVKNGQIEIEFTDEYGNTGAETLSVGNIDNTAPIVNAVLTTSEDERSVTVTFAHKVETTSERDKARTGEDIFLSYGGMVKTLKETETDGFTFTKEGTYTVRVFDKEGLSSYCTFEIKDSIDTKAPVITSVTWTYNYEEYNSETNEWETKTVSKTINPTEGSAGYRVGSDTYSLTNQDVTVTVKTDSQTTLSGISDKYADSHTRVYDENGMFIFNTEKKNGQITSYGVDIEVIDKTPPVISFDTGELIFYENVKMNGVNSEEELLAKIIGEINNFKAYDLRNGEEVPPTLVKVDMGGFDTTNLTNNNFVSSKPYTITYTAEDSVHNVTQTTRTLRLVGKNDAVVLINGSLPDSAGKSYIYTDSVSLQIKNFSGTSYVKYQKGLKTMGQMKTEGVVLSPNESGVYQKNKLTEGWHTFYVQTDKRDYFTIGVYVMK